jgi:hypothetical protein
VTADREQESSIKVVPATGVFLSEEMKSGIKAWGSATKPLERVFPRFARGTRNSRRIIVENP